MTGFFLAPRIAWGPGAIEQLSGLGARHALLCVDPAVASRPAARRVAEELAKSETRVDIVALPPAPDGLSAVATLAEQIRASAPDWLIALGGGRSLDAVKAARISSELAGVELSGLTPMHELTEPRARRLVAIPTTSGSGAEASWTADLVAGDGAPVEIAHRALVPDWALVDPGLAEGLPIEAIVDGGFEALGSAVEAFVSAWANPFSDALARDAASTVVGRLPHAVRWSDDPDARGALHYAATAAGLAASNAQRGLAHALARALVGPTRVPYGRLVGIALPPVLEFDRPGARERLEALADGLDTAADTPVVPLAPRLTRLRETTRLPATLREAGVSADAIAAARERVVDWTLRSPGALANPRVPSSADVTDLFDAIAGTAAGR